MFRPVADLSKNPQKACQALGAPASSSARTPALPGAGAGFTLPELLVVIVIIGILATMMGHGVVTAKRSARQTECKSNLRQFAAVLLLYRGENNSRNPPWLSNLYPDYIDSKSFYICRSDLEKGLKEVKPKGLIAINQDYAKFSGVEDNDLNSGRPRQNDDPFKIHQCSYLYEFSCAKLNDRGWYDGLPNKIKIYDDTEDILWCDYKESQMRFGDSQSGATKDNPRPYSESQLPIIRCFHHYNEARVLARPNDFPYYSQTPCLNLQPDYITINVAYSGTVYVGPLKWECRPQPGDK